MLSPIITQEECRKLQSLISESSNIVITCHQNADGDAIGSSLAWADLLRTAFGKEPEVIVPDQYPDYLHWLPGNDKVVRYDKHKEGCDWTLEHADLIFCLDFNNPSRLSNMEEGFKASGAKKILIDHHLDPNVDSVVTVSRPKASSTSELVFRIAWQMGLYEQMTKQFAVDVYCGMMTDTGCFTYNANDCDIFFIIGQLMGKNIDRDHIYRKIYHNFSENRLRLQGYVMYEKLVVNHDMHAAYFTLTRQDLERFHFIKGDAEGLVNMPLQMKNIRLSISLREDTERDNLVWVSLRSVGSFACNKIAERFFNGGGHANASGGKVFGTMEDAVRITEEAIKAFNEK